jgi:predicted ATP-grasp superfamily ATP-dependent carboligase
MTDPEIEKLKVKSGDVISADNINQIVEKMQELALKIDSIQGTADANEEQIERIKRQLNLVF